MCGIVGWLGPTINETVTTNMRRSLHHRGPDSWGEWRGRDIWLAHLRLAILDLTPLGHQPMISSCGRFIISFNGEVYNFKELRSELERCGVRFKSQTDTEVVLEACVEWGIEEACRKFEGMYAFALFDKKEEILWLARDPMGIKPLYYAKKGSNFAFSSELTPLLQLPWIDRVIDQSALFAYFRYICVPAPASIIEGIEKLESGCIIKVQGQKITRVRFWDLDERSQSLLLDAQNLTKIEAANELEALLKKSISAHMQSDVPYGAFLSGGIDSSTVVALMQSASVKPVKTFSIGFAEESHDESHHAKAIARHLGTDHQEMLLRIEDLPHLFSEVSDSFDEPFADNSAIPTFLVSKFARQSVTVCLSGDGGDELFGGYPRYFWAKRIENWKKSLTPTGAAFVSRLLQKTPSFFWDKIVNPALSYRYSGAEGLSHRVQRLAGYLGCSRHLVYKQMMSAWEDPTQLLNQSSDRMLGADVMGYPHLGWAEEMMLLDQKNYLQDDILTKVDRSSMAVSLEVRVPLLVHPIVEWSWKLDQVNKFDQAGDRGKLVLREVLYRYVPKELVDRPKQGFGMPIGKWLRSDLRDWAEDLLTPSLLDASGLQPGIVRKIWQEHLDGKDRQKMIWSVLMYRQWHKRIMGH